MGECISYPRLPNMAPVKQAAQLYGLSPYYIRRLCKAGKIRFVNAGRGWLVNLDSLARYFEQGDLCPQSVCFYAVSGGELWVHLVKQYCFFFPTLKHSKT